VLEQLLLVQRTTRFQTNESCYWRLSQSGTVGHTTSYVLTFRFYWKWIQGCRLSCVPTKLFADRNNKVYFICMMYNAIGPFFLSLSYLLSLFTIFLLLFIIFLCFAILSLFEFDFHLCDTVLFLTQFSAIQRDFLLTFWLTIVMQEPKGSNAN